jgi:hypothetical protein
VLLSSDPLRPAPDRATATAAGRSGRVEARMWPAVRLLRPATNACHLRLLRQLRRAWPFW